MEKRRTTQPSFCHVEPRLYGFKYQLCLTIASDQIRPQLDGGFVNMEGTHGHRKGF